MGIGNRPPPAALPVGIGNREWGIGTPGVVRSACRSRAVRGASRRALPKGVARFPQAAAAGGRPLPAGVVRLWRTTPLPYCLGFSILPIRCLTSARCTRVSSSAARDIAPFASASTATSSPRSAACASSGTGAKR